MSSPSTPMSEDEARQVAQEIKKSCLLEGVWVKCLETHKNGRLDSLAMEISIKVKK